MNSRVLVLAGALLCAVIGGYAWWWNSTLQAIANGYDPLFTRLLPPGSELTAADRERAVALRLALVAVDGSGDEAALCKMLHDTIGAMLGARENEHALHVAALRHAGVEHDRQ